MNQPGCIGFLPTTVNSVRAREGAGVAWLPRSLATPDLEAGLLTPTGDPAWEIKLEIRLHRLGENANQLTRGIWAFLAVREPVPLVAKL